MQISKSYDIFLCRQRACSVELIKDFAAFRILYVFIFQETKTTKVLINRQTHKTKEQQQEKTTNRAKAVEYEQTSLSSHVNIFELDRKILLCSFR